MNKSLIPSFDEYVLEEKLQSFKQDIDESVIDDVIFLFKLTTNATDFKEIVEREITRKYKKETWKLVEKSIQPLFNTLNESELFAPWMKPHGFDLDKNHNFQDYKPGTQNYLDFPSGVIVECINKELECFGLVGKIKALEGLYFRIETENGITFECKPEDIEIIK